MPYESVVRVSVCLSVCLSSLSVCVVQGEALYRHLCEPSLSLADPEEAALLLRHESCSAEDVRLNLMFVVMSALGMCATLPLGFLIDSFPTSVCAWGWGGMKRGCG